MQSQNGGQSCEGRAGLGPRVIHSFEEGHGIDYSYIGKSHVGRVVNGKGEEKSLLGLPRSNLFAPKAS